MGLTKNGVSCRFNFLSDSVFVDDILVSRCETKEDTGGSVNIVIIQFSWSVAGSFYNDEAAKYTKVVKVRSTAMVFFVRCYHFWMRCMWL